MIHGKTHQEISDANERIVEECFKRMGLKPVRLDVRGRRQKTKRTEFKVNDASGKPVVVCEVKTILSAGQSKERPGTLISTKDPKLHPATETKRATAFVYDVDFRRMETDMRRA